MNKGVKPICAAAETESHYTKREREKAKQMTHGVVYDLNAAVALRTPGTRRICHFSWQPAPQSSASEYT